jgi:hypothetical protein
MNSRVASGVLATAGGVAVAIGCYLPNSDTNGFENRIFETKAPHAVLFFAIEPAAVAIAAVVLGILVLAQPPLRFTPGVLLGIGVQTALMFVGYVGWVAQSQYGGSVKAGGWVGMLGAAAVAAAGAILLSEHEPSSLPGGVSAAPAETHAATQGGEAGPAATSFCTHCGAALQPTAVFCANCGHHRAPATPPAAPAG